MAITPEARDRIRGQRRTELDAMIRTNTVGAITTLTVPGITARVEFGLDEATGNQQITRVDPLADVERQTRQLNTGGHHLALIAARAQFLDYLIHIGA
jgi:hypothetical protein